MRRALLFVSGLLFCAAGAGCDFLFEQIDGSGQEAAETRDVAEFSAVQVTDSLEAKVTLDPDAVRHVEVRGDDNIVPLVRTRVEDGTLILELPESLGIRPRLPLVVTISTPALTAIEATDSAQARANQVDGGAVRIAGSDSAQVSVGLVSATMSLSVEAHDSAGVVIEDATVDGPLSVSASDAASVQAGNLMADGNVTVHAEDSSSAVLLGDAPALNAELHDSSALDADGLTVTAASIRGSSSSEAEVCATESLDVVLSDSSVVRYTCDPDHVSKKLDGSSAVTSK